ncbi:MAG: tRNA (adenosine(37)-N6)-threonylcarbamoyltransferase complex dimerization subunit type 1 TsaB [Paracoccaceae bacterium]|nr:MAG: tRNA (adenosine(37)-N6)-threonylcarbamoyltransferase complex dimerization subunit type 1 TsaB [Paracoccaceae bacterium]
MPPDRLVLGFDTSAAHCAAALLSGDRLVALADEPMATGQAERLMPMLEEMLAEAGIGWRDLSRIGVGTGPGNFSGVRISVAAARGLALGLGIPALGVTRLEALACGLGAVTVVEDARRGEAYVQAFGHDAGGAAPPPRPPATGAEGGARSGQVRPEGPARLMRVGDVGAARVTGSGAAMVPGAEVLAPAMPLAEAVARIAAGRTPGARPAPFYLRAADAAPPADPPPVILP